MGPKNFNAWIDSMQTKIPTDFKDRAELSQCVRRAGYDADDFGGMVKTHLKGEASFFFWQQIDGKWTAVFSNQIPQADIKTLITRIETAAGRQAFLSEAPVAQPASPQVAAAQPRRRIQVLERKIYPTNFRDSEKLVGVLAEHSLSPIVDRQGRVTCDTSSGKLLFVQQENQPFTVEILRAPNMQDVFQTLNQLNQGYCQVIQSETVSNVKSRLGQKGLSLHSEEVLADNTVVLTVEIP